MAKKQETKKQKVAIDEAIDREWQARDDAYTLRKYAELLKDSARLKAARNKLQQDQQDIAKILTLTQK